MTRAGAASADLRGWLDAFVADAHFLERYPYYAHVLAMIEPVADPSVPAMGVSLHATLARGSRYYLHVNAEQLLHTPQFLRGILLHEVHHIVLGHLSHPKFFGAAHPDLMQIAQETSANEFIDEPLPDPIVWQHFERQGFRAGQSTIERYEILCAARAEGERITPSREGKQVDVHTWANAPAPPVASLSETRRILEHTLEQAAADAPKVSAERGRIAGKTPAQLLAQLGGTLGPPEVAVDWREALRAFVARTRTPLHTWSRPSRRFPARIGEIPGRAYHHRSLVRPTLVIAIDTSLSMSESELAEVARQLTPLSALAQLFVVECDSAIARSYAFRGVIDRVHGRGGTDLRPVFAPSFLEARRADGVIYFTDGEGPYPDHAPPVPVLWMLTKPSAFTCPWGQRAQLITKAVTKKPSR